MTSRLVIAAVGLGCIAAAGTGGYLAVRTATVASEAATIQPATGTASSPVTPVPPAPPVEEPPVTASVAVVRPTPAPKPVTANHRVAAPAARTPPPAPAIVTAAADVPAPEVESLPAALPEPAEPERTPIPADRIRPATELVEVSLPASAVIGIRLDTTVSSETARVEDPVRARVMRAVVVDGVTVIPAGAQLNGSVTSVERGGRIREQSRIGIRFTSVDLTAERRVPIRTETIYREGESPTGEATAKIGASAVVGSILGGVIGGKKGAVIGGMAGAGGGTAVVMRGERNEATLPSGSTLTVRLSEAATFEIER